MNPTHPARTDPTQRTAVITGGAGDLGRSIASRLHRDGIVGALWDIDIDRATAAAEATGEGWIGIGADLTDSNQVAQATKQTTDHFGHVDILVTSAGITGPSIPTVEYDSQTWHRVVDINLNAVFYCSRALIPVLMSSAAGRMVHISSVAGKEGNPNLSAYSAAKAGVIALTKTLGKELATTNI